MPVPEAVRERDLFRYFQPWLDGQSLVNAKPTNGGTAWPLTYNGYKPQTSRDKAMTAFCQIACLRLGVRRAMISLIDGNQQYILAEATKTLSLKRGEAQAAGDEVWLGNSVIARKDGVDEHVFSSTYTAKGAHDTRYTTEALVVEDMRKDPRFKDRQYVKDESVLMYAGVPIKTRSGHRIGVYGVSSEFPWQGGFCVDDITFMEDCAATVMEHLEMAKDRQDRNRGEKMVRGLAEFIEGFNLSPEQEPHITGDTPMRKGHTSRTLERQTENLKLTDAHDSGYQTSSATSITSVSSPKRPSSIKEKPEQPEEDEMAKVFPRAAEIIRKATQADGIVFFGAIAGSVSSVPAPVHGSAGHSITEDSPSSSDMQTSEPTPRRRRRADSSGSTKEKSKNSSSEESHKNMCEVLALSITQEQIEEQGLTPSEFALSEVSMERYIRRYPYGKFFSFTDRGSGISSGDESVDDTTKPNPASALVEVTVPKNIIRRNKKKKDAFIPTELLKVLPGIRSLIFLPLWDYTEEKFIAGAFIWTSTAGRLMSPSNELPYLKAFGNSIMSEIARINAQKADRAKSTFIASVSHELRSPLHGILGGVEFLMDTSMDDYQKRLLSSVETCGKTLLDTIDHVLDYAKINKLRNATNGKNKKDVGVRKKSQLDDSSIMGLNTEFNLAGLVEEATESVCAGHTSKRKYSGTTIIEGGQADKDVAILLSIDPRTKRTVRSQPGAIRRIVMNILGNALKYTPQGFISVSLELREPEQHDVTRLPVKLRFVDSGKGMSVEYQRTKLFSPFSQEDPFTAGTGLGLSIVRQIIEQLGGCICVNSTQGVGTQVDVKLALPIYDQSEIPKAISNLPISETRGKRICMLIPPPHESNEMNKFTSKLALSIEKTCKAYFGFEVEYSSETAHADADVLVIPEPPSSEALIRHHGHSIGKGRNGKNVPIIVCCSNLARAVEFRAKEGQRIISMGRRLEVVAQPCGPQKLAQLFEQLFKDSQSGTPQAEFLPKVFSPPVLEQSEMIAAEKRDMLESATVSPLSTPPANGPQMQLGNITESLHKGQLPYFEQPYTQPTVEVTSIESRPPLLRRTSARNTKLNILLVDDNPINLQLLVMFMKKHSLPYSSAQNGLEAFETYRAAATANPPKYFDYVLMDISMPVMDGLESTRHIRKFEQENGHKPTCIIALTGLASQQAQEEALGSGVDRYLPKPVKFGMLKELLNT